MQLSQGTIVVHWRSAGTKDALLASIWIILEVYRSPQFEMAKAMERESTPRLLADAMLGKLARWLRILGYDTRYIQSDDSTVAQRARVEGRILLTRDRELARRRGLRTLLITSQRLEAQIAQVVGEVGPPADATPRCMHCNVRLVVISAAQARPHVPAYVAATQKVFHRCPKCGKIYWRGTHWQGINHRLQQTRQSTAEETPSFVPDHS